MIWGFARRSRDKRITCADSTGLDASCRRGAVLRHHHGHHEMSSVGHGQTSSHGRIGDEGLAL